MLVNTKDLLLDCYKKGYAVGAFNFSNMEQLQAIIKAHENKNHPVICACSKSAMEYMGVEMCVSMVRTIAEKSPIKIALHLDHGADFEICKKAIDNGFTSVMIDASSLSLEDNIATTKKVVEYAHARNVTVEAELGKLSGIEDEVNVECSNYTNPQEAKYFVEQTGVDSLAVSIGTSHGAYKFAGESKLEISILEEIKNLTNIPLVLHGASSIPQYLVEEFNALGGALGNAKGVDEDNLREAVKHGITKINVDSDCRIAMVLGIKKALQDPKLFDPRKVIGKGKDEMVKLIESKIENVYKANLK
ncbi:MAG: class II fructose-1,6-bisphosphate aldolase [Clostridia bacterium]|nr:class II fructose-1,6-bisphosphate aldolase [Clostridia bacterium]